MLGCKDEAGGAWSDDYNFNYLLYNSKTMWSKQRGRQFHTIFSPSSPNSQSPGRGEFPRSCQLLNLCKVSEVWVLVTKLRNIQYLSWVDWSSSRISLLVLMGQLEM